MLLLALACSAPPMKASDTAVTPHVDDEELEIVPGNGDTGSAEPITPDVALFDESIVHSVDIVLDEATTRALSINGMSLAEMVAAMEYGPAEVTIDGNPVGPVGVRLKGGSTWRQLGQKAAFKIDFNFLQPGKSYDGYTKINLNNMLSDTTQLHEMMAWEVFRVAGLPAQRGAYAWVTVNGQDYGLYLLLEVPDQDVWLDRTFGNHDGRIYEGGYPYYPVNTLRVEFTAVEAVTFDLEAGASVDNADVIAAAAVIDQTSATWDADVAPYLDTEAFARFYMAEVWSGQWDGYVTAVNNFRVYVGADGQVQLLASGLDWSFSDLRDWTQGSAVVARRCREDTVCAERLRAALEDVSAAADGAGLVARFETLQALIQPSIEADPMKETDEATIAREQTLLREWLETRSDQLADLWE